LGTCIAGGSSPLQMKSRTALYVVIALILALGGIWFLNARQEAQPTQVFPATVNRDCAPWDGAAFTVSIPMDSSILDISIFQSPSIKSPAAFALNENTIDTGDAFLFPSAGPPEPLTGRVHFEHIEEGIPVEGEFHFTTRSGEQHTGRFEAQWRNEIVYCG
jgi:hypothetical protein